MGLKYNRYVQIFKESFYVKDAVLLAEFRAHFELAG